MPTLNVIDSGKGKAVAMLSKKRLQKMPDVATFLELGGERQILRPHGLYLHGRPGGFAGGGRRDLFTHLRRRRKDAQAWQRMQAAGAEDPPMDRQDFKRVQRDEAPIWLQLAGSLGLTPE